MQIKSLAFQGFLQPYVVVTFVVGGIPSTKIIRVNGPHTTRPIFFKSSLDWIFKCFKNLAGNTANAQ
jgi:hypothetical protein